VAYDPNFKIAELAKRGFHAHSRIDARALAARAGGHGARRDASRERRAVISGVVAGHDGHGPRYAIEGDGDRPFLRMNSNSYLGMALRSEVIEAGGTGCRRCVAQAPAPWRFHQWHLV